MFFTFVKKSFYHNAVLFEMADTIFFYTLNPKKLHFMICQFTVFSSAYICSDHAIPDLMYQSSITLKSMSAFLAEVECLKHKCGHIHPEGSLHAASSWGLREHGSYAKRVADSAAPPCVWITIVPVKCCCLDVCCE